MAEQSHNIALYAVVVILLMMGTAAMGFMSLYIGNQQKDYETPHDYEVSGTYIGYDASGTGHSRYINESQREYLYHFTTSVSYGSSEETLQFDIICGEDKVPVSIYEKGPAETVGGAECVWWSYQSDSKLHEFAIDGSMTVRQYRISASDGSWALTGNLSG